MASGRNRERLWTEVEILQRRKWHRPQDLALPGEPENLREVPAHERLGLDEDERKVLEIAGAGPLSAERHLRGK